MRIAWLGLALAGCDLVFELRDPSDSVGELCGDRPDPLRYFSPASTGFAWIEMSDICAGVGMDLVVFNTDAEFLRMRTEGSPAYWTGLMGDGSGGFTSVDQCPFVTRFAPDQPEDPNGCVGVDENFEMFSIPCSQAVFGALGIRGLCETPQPTAACIARSSGNYSIAPRGTHAEASTACRDLVELDSSEEIVAVEDFAIRNAISEFWLAPVYDGRWSSPPLDCPSVFPWAPDEPRLDNTPICAVYVVGIGVMTRSCDQEVEVICER